MRLDDFTEDDRALAMAEECDRLDRVAAARQKYPPMPPPERRCTRECPIGHQVIVEMGAVSGWCNECRAYRLTMR